MAPFATIGIAGLYLWLSHFAGPLTFFHWVFCGFVVLMQLLNDKTRAYLKSAIPLLIFVLCYDFFPKIPHRWWGPVRIAEPQQWELALLGFSPADWFQAHTHIAADLLATLFYFLHFWSFIFFSLYLWWKHRSHFSLFAWAFCATNLAWMATVIVFPTA